MKQVIEKLTLDAFKRWYKQPSGHEYLVKERWEELCAEAEKREPIEAWAILCTDGSLGFHTSKEKAQNVKKVYPDVRLIRLVEEQEK